MTQNVRSSSQFQTLCTRRNLFQQLFTEGFTAAVYTQLPRRSTFNCLTIISATFDWNTMDSSLTSAFLYLMHLPTINHIDLSYIQNFPLSSFTPSANLHRLDISHLYLKRFDGLEEEVSSEIVILSEMIPKIREFHTLQSPLVTTRLLLAKNQDGQPAFDFTDLRRLSICFGDEQNIRYLLQNAKLLEKLHLSVGSGQSALRLYDILSSSTGTFKTLDFSVSIYNSSYRSVGFARDWMGWRDIICWKLCPLISL